MSFRYWATLLAALGCRDPQPEAPRAPLSQRELATTDPGIAAENLEAQITGLEKMLSVDHYSKLVNLRLQRARCLSRISDHDRALELAEELVRKLPANADSYLLRARVYSVLHRFREALADLDEARQRGASGAGLRELEAVIAAAQGRAFELPESPGEDGLTTALRASLLAESGQLAKAEALFILAQHRLRDTSPYPLAGIYFQQGLMWQRAGNLPRAKELFEASHQRMPCAPTVAHLASVLEAMHEKEAAIRLLRPVAESAEDPEAAGRLASLLEADSRAEFAAEARALRERASARYEALMSKHPAAFADHAARFWLGTGDAKRALQAAEKNLAERETDESFALAFEAAVAAHDAPAACRLIARANLAPRGKQLDAMRALALETCGAAKSPP